MCIKLINIAINSHTTELYFIIVTFKYFLYFKQKFLSKDMYVCMYVHR